MTQNTQFKIILFSFQLYDWVLEHQEKIVDLFYKFDIERDDGTRSGKLSKDNLMTCLLTLSKLRYAIFQMDSSLDHTQVNISDPNMRDFPGAPIDNELLKKVIDAHDPNRTDSVDYTVFLTGKKFVNKVMITPCV